MVARCAAVACLAVLAGAHPALAADHQIAASPNSLTFSPNELTVAPGDTATISYAGGATYDHNSHYGDQAAGCPLAPTFDPWSCPRTFEALGDYTFYCDAHSTMTGTVHVRDPQSGGPPPPSPPPPGSGTPPPDVAAPVMTLRGATAQRVIRRRAVVVKVRTDEAATLRATGRVSLPPPARLFRLRKVTRPTSGGEVVSMKLKLSRKALAAVKRALALRRKVRASIRISATDAAGNRTVSSRRIALKR